MNRSFAPSVVALLLAAGPALLLAGCSGEAQPKRAAEVPRTVSVAQVASEALAATTTASGLLVAREEAAVGVEQAGVRVLRVFVEEGAQVKAGQALAVLDDALLRQRVAQARAQAEKAKAEADRVEGLDSTGVISDEDIGSRRSQARIATAQLRELETQIGQMTVRAPVSGMVVERTVRPGSLSSGEPMFRVVRDNEVELDAEVPEIAILGVRPGQAVKVTLADGTDVDGTVRLISPRIDPQTKLGRVRVAMPTASMLRVGGFARATFASGAAPVAVVPEKAVHFEASGPSVIVIGADNRAHRMPVKTGQRSRGRVELVQGPPIGTQVALAGGAFLIDGDLVKPGLGQPAASGAK
ncbi:efflux RND transporter periplasmic adaptor subunit [Variovorax sp. KK3]|uniref:efflux RND transporter periplasmic adaptor subunit n=1 Tax=Variovorax sp. KK3 TaxID=1855728 RepID=UPI00097C4FBA|nr:efflux RND transporter periplasmic adaptor subunit [Variovorax sp. KK3]